jgi:hypothetical protein
MAALPMSRTGFDGGGPPAANSRCSDAVACHRGGRQLTLLEPSPCDSKSADLRDNTCMPRVHTIELLVALAALLLVQIALLCEVPAANEPSAMLSSIAFGLLVAHLSDSRAAHGRVAWLTDFEPDTDEALRAA